ncbi:hypothetical protein IFU40_06815 [Microbacterium sp. CFBP 13617]|uniref:hypothetical protein n=1 Tax=Microbacterium sp. CFBP 13617 TaxID=2774035 RepID=UPI0017832DC4|nr:hypothetical protein [Microbacterium sp. CFBP 13617]MBD8218342.1 hypothetical protein [Microbacterium sp. CFBP 13617]
MFINHKLRIGDTVTISFTGDVSHEITGKLIGWDQHHVGLQREYEQYIPWTAVGSLAIIEKAPEETYSVEDSIG